MFVSVIIPTYNEEKYIPRLLRALKKQTYPELEVIVSDAHSTDGTREIAASFGVQVVDGGLPSVGRNRGAAAAQGDFYFFLDADIIIPSNFIEKAVAEIEEKSIGLAGCEARPLSTKLLDKVLHKFAHVGMKITKDSNPRIPGYCLLISRKIFDKVSGFDETIRVAEDLNLVTRAVEHTPVHILESTYIQVSMRRYAKEGRLPYLGKSIQIYFYRKFKGEIKDDKDIEYEFGNFEDRESKEFASLLERVQDRLERLEKRISKLMGKKGKVPEELRKNFQEIADTLSNLLSNDDEDSWKE